MGRYWRQGVLIALVLLIYAQTANFGFLNYDDDGYVTANRYVLQGLVPESIGWAFTSMSRFYWHPLTWLSLMADMELFGANPGAMHVVNVVLHGATALLVFLVLARLTGGMGRSFVVAALFAVHPLRVESVAWVAERKDVLSGFLMLGTLWAYQQYVSKPGRSRYVMTLAIFVLACMAKPMAIIVPLLFILVDFWPLRRRAWRDKVPFFAIAALFAIATYIGARQMGALDMLQPASLATRIQNAVWSIGQYLRQTFVPSGFSIVYPYPSVFPGVAFVAAALAAMTGIAIWQRHARPWILTGWLWFVVGLAPTLGLVQAGVQGRADRFTYIPQIGLLMAIVWTAAEALPARRQRPFAAACILTLAAVSFVQTPAWKSSETIFAQALANTEDNWLAEHKYGLALLERGETAGASMHLRRAAALDKQDPHSRFHLGRIAAAAHKPADAVELFTETVRLKPDYADAHFSRAMMLVSVGRNDEAIAAFNRARQLRLEPQWEFQAELGMGVLLARSGRIAEAEKHFQAAVRLQPGSAEARQNLAVAQEQLRPTVRR